MMAKMIKKTMAMVLALCICFSALPLQALAAEDGTVEKTKDGVTTTVTTQTETTKDPATGDTTVTVTIQKDTEGTKTSTGVKVEGSETKVTTTVTDEDGKKTTTKVEDGYEKTETEIPNSVEDVTVEISTKTDDPSTEENEGQNVGTTPVDPTKEPEIKGDKPKGEDDKKYNYTETYEKPGTVTVDTTEVKIEEKVDVEGTDLGYVRGDVVADADNDLAYVKSYYSPDGAENAKELAGKTELTEEELKNLEVPKDCEYVILGSGNGSQFYAGLMYKTPVDENEEPSYIAPDGTKYYTHRGKLGGSYQLEGAYQNGELVDPDAKFGGIWSNIAHYVLVDAESGEMITTYCADINTPTEDGYGYNIENIEDGTYYSEEQAAMIRTVAKNGYWGVEGDASTDGSLESVKAMMREAKDADGNDIFTKEEIDRLTDGAAMTATQYAIWTFSNYMSDIEFLNVQYIKKDANNVANIGYGYNGLKNVPDSEKATVDLIFKLYNHLIHMAPTELEGTTRDTIINADNFIDDMEITVVEKAKGHENNKDKNKDNDAYVTNLTFALVVEVDEKNGDNLKVSVVDGNGNPILNAEGKPVVGRIAGALEEGEIQLVNNGGNYCFENIVLTEGENTFKLNLEGIQNLQEGVYLYSSEVRADAETGEEVSSQTMVGIASGKRGVSVSMDLKFELDVKDKVVVKERVWHSEKTNDNTTPPPGGNVPPNNPPEEPQLFNLNREDGVVIIDEQVPLAAAPKTGDNSFLFIALALFAAISLCAANFDKKRKHEAF